MSGRTLLVGPSSKNGITGISMSFELLVAGFVERRLDHSLVDLSSVGPAARAGSFDMQRAVATLKMLGIFGLRVWCAKRVYITIASSRFGFLRDATLIWISRLLRRPVTLHLHGGGYHSFYYKQPRWLQPFIRLTLVQARVIIVLGKLLKDQFDFVPDIKTKMRIVPNGLPLKLQPQTAVAKSINNSTSLRLLYLSNMIKSKGYIDVLAACRILHHDYGMQIHCDFCGEFRNVSTEIDWKPPHEAHSDFLQMIQDWKLSNSVTYHGVVTGLKKQRLLSDANILVLPTTYPWEGQPICIIEALSFGIPVISTRFHGIPEQVIDGYNGFLVKEHAPDQIADAVRKMVQERKRYSFLSQNAIDHYKKNFTRDVYVNRLIGVILGAEEHLANCDAI